MTAIEMFDLPNGKLWKDFRIVVDKPAPHQYEIIDIGKPPENGFDFRVATIIFRLGEMEYYIAMG